MVGLLILEWRAAWHCAVEPNFSIRGVDVFDLGETATVAETFSWITARACGRGGRDDYGGRGCGIGSAQA